MVLKCTGQPVCAPTLSLGVSPVLHLKQLQCFIDRVPHGYTIECDHVWKKSMCVCVCVYVCVCMCVCVCVCVCV